MAAVSWEEDATGRPTLGRCGVGMPLVPASGATGELCGGDSLCLHLDLGGATPSDGDGGGTC